MGQGGQICFTSPLIEVVLVLQYTVCPTVELRNGLWTVYAACGLHMQLAYMQAAMERQPCHNRYAYTRIRYPRCAVCDTANGRASLASCLDLRPRSYATAFSPISLGSTNLFGNKVALQSWREGSCQNRLWVLPRSSLVLQSSGGGGVM